MKSPFFIMLIGLPLAGKSTFYENYLKQSDHTFLSTDDYIEKQCKENDLTYNQGFEYLIRPACDWLHTELKRAVESQNIIIDQTNLNVKSRKRKLKLIPNHYHKTAIYLPITLEESLRRNTRPGKIIPENVIRSMNDSIQIPTVEECFDQVFIGTDSFLSVYPTGLKVQPVVL